MFILYINAMALYSIPSLVYLSKSIIPYHLLVSLSASSYNILPLLLIQKNYIDSLSSMEPERFSVKMAKESIKEVRLHNLYELPPEHNLYEIIELIVAMVNEKNRDIMKEFPPIFKISYFSSIQFVLSKCKMEEEICTICMQQFEIKDFEKEVAQSADQDILTLGCSHKYHRNCLNALINGRKWLKCPICGSIFGIMIGDQPDGTINVSLKKNLRCEGYNDVGTIVIQYNMKAGSRNGAEFPATNRTGYLPDTPEGRQVRDLLCQAFERKLTFTIGRSVTTGMDNQIVWNGIHHKTVTNGGAANFGYPDPTYLKRVKEQLALKGIVPK